MMNAIVYLWTQEKILKTQKRFKENQRQKLLFGENLS